MATKPYKLDKHGHAVRNDGETTDPYGHITWSVGNGDDFHCFDFLDLGDKIALHSVVNSETGSFIQDAQYGIHDKDVALDVAKEMVDDAISWLVDGGEEVILEDDDKGSAIEFLREVQKLCGGELSESDEKHYSMF